MRTAFIRFDGNSKKEVGSIDGSSGKLIATGFGQTAMQERPAFKGSDAQFLKALEDMYRPPYLYAVYSA